VSSDTAGTAAAVDTDGALQDGAARRRQQHGWHFYDWARSVEMSDRGLAWVGPPLFGLAYRLTGDYRAAILSLIAFCLIGFALLARVPVRRAVQDAGNPAPQRI
jgi:MFS-type transporter involved in bile tolerance (Atg22 family)